MARKGFWRGGINFLQEIDRIAATTAYNGPKAAAERIVREMQQAGPSWTGKFSNSWQIQTPTRLVQGSGSPGEPQPIRTPSVTGQEVTRNVLLNDNVVFTISNFAEHALEAIDAIEHDRAYYARRKTRAPQTQLGLSKWQLIDEPRRKTSVRGQIGGGEQGQDSSRTAPLDWFATYASRELGRAIQIEMDSALRRRFR